MKVLLTRMLMALTTIVLLFVALIVVRLHGLKSEKSLFSLSIPFALHIPFQVAPHTPSTLAEEYAQVELPELRVKSIARLVHGNRGEISRPEFLQITKEVHILEEVFAPAKAGSSQGEDWPELRGATEIRTNDGLESTPVIVAIFAPTNFISLVPELPKDTMIAESELEPNEEVGPAATPPLVADEVAVKQAKSIGPEDQEPAFFDYPEKKESQTAQVSGKQKEENDYSPPAGWDLPVGQSAKTIAAALVPPVGNTATPMVTKQPSTIDKKRTLGSVPNKKVVTTQSMIAMADGQKQMEKSFSLGEPSRVVVRPLSVNSHSVSALHQFEVRAKDDDGVIWEDSGEGEIQIVERVAGGAQARSVLILHKDHVPTHVDVPLPGNGLLEVPMLSADFLGGLSLAPRSVPTGSVLVELDGETDSIVVDGVTPEMHKLTKNFKVVEGESEHHYLLLTGVEVGNRTLTAVRFDGRKAMRLLHVHEEEVTFDVNLYGSPRALKLELREESLLAQGNGQLVIAGTNVRRHFTNEPAQKATPSTYTFPVGPTLLGVREYLSLTHLGEPLYLGVGESGHAELPTEELMREVIRRFKLGGNSQACVIQINLDPGVKSYRVQAESHGEGHVSFGLVLDEDGKFYESMGANSRKLFVMSENQGGDSLSSNAKINISLEYENGSTRYFPSYCSPNTYLVEQL